MRRPWPPRGSPPRAKPPAHRQELEHDRASSPSGCPELLGAARSRAMVRQSLHDRGVQHVFEGVRRQAGRRHQEACGLPTGDGDERSTSVQSTRIELATRVNQRTLATTGRGNRPRAPRALRGRTGHAIPARRPQVPPKFTPVDQHECHLESCRQSTGLDSGHSINHGDDFFPPRAESISRRTRRSGEPAPENLSKGEHAVLATRRQWHGVAVRVTRRAPSTKGAGKPSRMVAPR